MAMSSDETTIDLAELDPFDPGSASAPVRHRRGLKRSSAACRRCRQRKQKCDGKHPSCRTCLSAGVACIPSERLVVKPDNHHESQELLQQVLDLKAENETLKKQLSASAAQSARHVTAPDDRIQPCGPVSERRSCHNASGDNSPYIGRILLPTFRRSYAAESANTPFLSSPWHLWQGLESWGEATRDPLPEAFLDQAGEFVELFFARRWPQFPIIHKPTFMSSCFDPFIGGQTCTGLSLFQVNIVLAIGASEKARASSEGPALHHHFFETAVRHLNAVLIADDLECIQNLLLLCMYGSNEPQCVDLWYTIGLALRIVLGIDLHREEMNNVGDFVEAQMRKRIFWSVYTMERSMSIAMGRPICLQDIAITTALPLCLSDSDLLRGHEDALPSVLPRVDGLNTFLHIIQLRRINAEIYSALHSAGKVSSESSETVDGWRYQYLARLNEWLAAAPRFVAPASMHQTAEWQQIAYHQAVLTLFRPSHVSPVITLDAMRLCSDSAISLVSCYHTLHAKNKVTYTFVALVSLFMAAVTMLYTLRASRLLRQQLTKEIAESNIETCALMVRRISSGQSVGERTAQIIQRLGKATVAIFDGEDPSDEDVDTEFMSWFGLRCRRPQVDGQSTPSIDIAWVDLFDQGFDLSNIFCSDNLL